MGHPREIAPFVILAGRSVAGGVDGDLLAVAVPVLANQLTILLHPGHLSGLVKPSFPNQPIGQFNPLV